LILTAVFISDAINIKRSIFMLSIVQREIYKYYIICSFFSAGKETDENNRPFLRTVYAYFPASKYLCSIAAASARVALPCGSSRRPGLPDIMPAPQDHFIALIAYSETLDAS